MHRAESWQADRFRFAVQGRGAQRLFGQAAQQGIPLRHIRCGADGYTATAAGRDKARLQALIAKSGWQWTLLRRQGPGRYVELALRRAGLPLGLTVFLLLVHLLPGFVWSIDLDGLDSAQQLRLRGQLAAQGITEGSWLTEDALQAAQQALSMQGGAFGWLSLNFTGGCLRVESTSLEQQPIRPTPQGTALYAKAGGEVLAIEVDSGFAAVTPGQYVAEGQLLAAATRPDRDGDPVTQAASGRVLARLERQYTVTQPLQCEQTVLSGASADTVVLYFLGHRFPLAGQEQAPDAAAHAVTQWLPLHLGRVALPGCICRTTAWAAEDCRLTYSADTAAALAARACRLRLADDFPDAVVEAQQCSTEAGPDAVTCTVRYRLRADIAAARPAPQP